MRSIGDFDRPRGRSPGSGLAVPFKLRSEIESLEIDDLRLVTEAGVSLLSVDVMSLVTRPTLFGFQLDGSVGNTGREMPPLSGLTESSRSISGVATGVEENPSADANTVFTISGGDVSAKNVVIAVYLGLSFVFVGAESMT